jgi:hypothetical protein
VEIELSPCEIAVATMIAKGRNDANRKAGIPVSRHSKEDWMTVELQGIGAELAYCRMCNIYPDFTLHIRQGGEDCIMQCGLRVDVKATHHENGVLLVPTTKPIGDVDLYALMIGRFPKYKFVGWVEAEKAQRPVNLKLWGDNQVYVIGQDQLIQCFPILSAWLRRPSMN